MKGNRTKKKSKIFDIIRLLILLVGISVLLYPTVSNYLYQKNSSRVITDYDEKLKELTEEEMNRMLEEAKAYNAALSGNTQLSDPFSTKKKEEDLTYKSLLNANGSGMMGYIHIPKIHTELPIYHGTRESILQKGVGHFEGTSLPVGGESTHTVLTGHRGLPSARLFTDLDKMEKGDVFYLKILNQTLAYEVDQILTVRPEETSALSVEEGKDYATLVTCTPYAVNTHRLLVRGHRIPYEEAVKIQPNAAEKAKIPLEILALGIAVLVLTVVWIITWIIRRKKRHGKNKIQ